MVDRVPEDFPSDDVMIRYLLGELPEQQRAELEEKYFADHAIFEQLSAVEDELIDAYVRGELEATQRERFEKLFLGSPQRRQRVEFARSLVQHLSQPPDLGGKETARSALAAWWEAVLSGFRLPRRAVLVPLGAAVLALAIVVGWRLAQKETRPPIQVQQKEAVEPPPVEAAKEPPTAPPVQLPQELVPPVPQVVSFALLPGITRDIGEAQKLSIPPTARLVRLRLDLEGEEYPSYRVVIRTVEGRPVWSGKGLKPRPSDAGKSIFLELPQRVFRSGDYVLTLSGLTAKAKFEDANDYSFRVAKQ